MQFTWVSFISSVALDTIGNRVDVAIQRAQSNLLRLQHPDGHWAGELFVDSTLCSDYVAYMHWAGEHDPVLEEKCIAHIMRRQLPDGGWNIYEGGPSELNASVKAYFALKLAGHTPSAPHMHEARACILRLGGIPRMNTYAKLYLALLGQFPWKYLPTVPAEMIFFPNWLFFNIHELSSWSRAMLMPLAILNHYKPTRQLAPEKQLHELYPAGTEKTNLGLDWTRRKLTWPNFFLVCDRLLKLVHHLPWRPWRAMALKECEEWMVSHMGEGSDGLAAIFPAMLNSMIALKTLGYEKNHPVLAKADRDFAGLFVDDPQDFRIQPCLSPVWDTAINLIALIESGLDPQREEVQRAAQWLSDREVRRAGDWCVKTPAWSQAVGLLNSTTTSFPIPTTR
jgi:squalene-hopene/tetraprenyl-beta-curcumene cyclase